MSRLRTLGHRLFLRALRWRAILRSHPLRVRLALSLFVSSVVVLVFRHYLWVQVPIWLSKLSHRIFIRAQAHPLFGRILHVLFNAIPDFAFALLAIAGLAYLVPKRYLDKIEELVWVRIFLLVLFVTVGFSAIIINAIKTENQEYKDGQNEERMGTVLKSVLNIQEDLKPKAVNLTEAERKEHLLESLRDEYIASHASIDPEILAGKSVPPEAWMNKRLSDLGETWRVKDAPRQLNSQNIPQVPLEEKGAQIEASFFQQDMSGGPLTVKVDPMTDNKVTVSVIAMVKGDTPAENVQLWFRVCRACQWTPPDPVGFSPANPDYPSDRMIFIPEMLPNVASQKWNLSIQLPTYPRYESIQIAFYFACKNCAPVDPKRPQQLWVTKTLQGGFKLQSPSISYTQQPVPK